MARALLLIEASGSLSEAARRLGITQPAVSKGLSQLEKRHGVKLLRRGSRPVGLTEEGAALARYAVQADRLQDAALRQLDDARRHKKGTVRLGSFGSSASFHILPKTLLAFSKLYPGISLEIREHPDMELQEVLRDGGVDVAILADPSAGDLEFCPLVTDQLVALLPAAHRLADQSEIAAADLAGDPFILTKGGSGPLVERWFAAAGVAPTIAHSITQVNSILALVSAGLGVSVIAELALPKRTSGCRILPLMPRSPRSIGFARSRDMPRSQAAERFWAYCENAAASSY